MGSAQSTTRLKLRCIFPSSSDYSHLPSSPSKQQLLIDDAFNYYNLPEQYETAIKDILTATISNGKRVADSELRIERLVSKNIAMEENIRKCSSDTKKVIELERTIERLLSVNALMEKNIKENTTSVKKVGELEKKIELLEKLLLSNNSTVEINQKEIIANEKKVTDLDKNVHRIEKLLQSKNEATEGNIKKLQAKADGLALMSLTQNNTDLELDKHMEEPEYVNRMMGLILMLIFVVFVLIGMQL